MKLVRALTVKVDVSTEREGQGVIEEEREGARGKSPHKFGGHETPKGQGSEVRIERHDQTWQCPKV